MPKHWKYIFIAAIITLLCWFYATSTVKYRKGALRYKNYTYHINDYLLQPSNSLCSQKLYLIILVTSYVGHVELRSAHRRAMNSTYLRAMNASRIFLLARIPEKETAITQAAIADENNIFGDLLQGSFDEHYRNLTHKHLMGLKWASSTCQDATFLIKLDDDIVFNLEKTYQLLSEVNENKRDLLLGKVMYNMKPAREQQNKWFVTWEEYGSIEYPPYLSGWFYITTPQVVGKLVDEAIFHPYFWIDDVFLGVMAQTLNLKLTYVPKGFWMDYYEYVECCIRDMLKKDLRCDHVVGPNGGRDNLIVEFNDAIEKCNHRKQCMSVTENKSSCVHWRDREIFSDGRGIIHRIN